MPQGFTNIFDARKSLSVQMVKGGLALGVWEAWLTPLSVLNALFIIYILSVYEYGIYKLVFSIISLASGLLFERMDGIIFNDIARALGEKQEKRASCIFFEYCFFKLGLGLLGGILLFLGSWAASYYFAPFVIQLLRIGSAFVILYSLQDILRVFLQANLKLFWLGALGVMQEIIQFIFLIGLFYFLGWRGVGMVLMSALIPLGITSAVYFWKFLPLLLSWWRNFQKSENLFYKIMATYGKWGILTGFVNGLSSGIPLWLIKLILNTEAVAIYSMAFTILSALQSLVPVGKVSNIFTPYIIGEQERVKRLMAFWIKYTTLFFVFLAIAGFFAMPLVVEFIYPKYISSLPLFKVMLVSFIFWGATYLTSDIVYSLRDQKFIFFRTCLKIALFFVFNVITLLLFGLWGAAISLILISPSTFIMNLWRLKKTYPEGLPDLKVIFTFGEADRILFGRLWQKALARVGGFWKKP